MRYVSKSNTAELLEKRRLSLNAAIRDIGVNNTDIAREMKYTECYVSQVRSGCMSVSDRFISVFCGIYGLCFEDIANGTYRQRNRANDREIVRDIALITALCRKKKSISLKRASLQAFGHGGSINVIYRFEHGLNAKIDPYMFEPIAEFYGLDKRIVYDDELRKRTLDEMGLCA